MTGDRGSLPVELLTWGSGSLALLAAVPAAAGGPDLAGIALVITAVSGLVATVGALVIGLRKKPGAEATEIALAVLAAQEQMRKDEGET